MISGGIIVGKDRWDRKVILGEWTLGEMEGWDGHVREGEKVYRYIICILYTILYFSIKLLPSSVKPNPDKTELCPATHPPGKVSGKQDKDFYTK